MLPKKELGSGPMEDLALTRTGQKINLTTTEMGRTVQVWPYPDGMAIGMMTHVTECKITFARGEVSLGITLELMLKLQLER